MAAVELERTVRAALAAYELPRQIAVRPIRTIYLPVLMAARHAATLTWLAAKQRRGENDIPIERHVEIRVAELERLAMQ